LAKLQIKFKKDTIITNGSATEKKTINKKARKKKSLSAKKALFDSHLS